MLPNKKSYEEENDLIDEYCKRQGCSTCNGSDMNGEPNGYGCKNMEAWVEKHAGLIGEDSTGKAENKS